MTFEPRFALVLLAAFFLSSLLTSALASLLTSSVLQARAGEAAPRASALALFRLLPAVLALALTAGILAPGYFVHEQRAELEGVGLVLACFAVGGVVLLSASCARIAMAVRRGSAARRTLMAASRPIDLPGSDVPAYAVDAAFPMVAVLGVVRPRLFIAESVLQSCSPHELRAIVEHERAHLRRGDNAMRLLMDATPDLLSFTRAHDAIAAAWHRAVEQRADDAAERRLDLASALVKVARAASGARALDLPASALYRGEDEDGIVSSRVRRLVGGRTIPSTPTADRVLAGGAVLVGSAIVATAVTGSASTAAHAILEFTVSALR